MDSNFNNSSFLVDEYENCSACNNSLCWSDEDFQQYLYYTQVIHPSKLRKSKKQRHRFPHDFCLQVTAFEGLIILINASLVICGVGGNILVNMSLRDILWEAL